MKEIDVRRRLLARWAVWAGTHGWNAVLIAAALTLMLGVGFARLSLEMTFFSVMPRSSKHVQDLEIISSEFAFASQILMVVDGRAIADRDDAETAVKKTLLRLEEEFAGERWADHIEGVTARFDRGYFREHGLMLMSPDDIDRFASIYADPNLVPLLAGFNDALEGDYAGNDDQLMDDEVMISGQFEGLLSLLEQLAAALEGEPPEQIDVDHAVADWLYGDEFFLSDDGRMGIAILRPTFTLNEFMELPVISAMEETAAQIAAEAGAESGATGMIVVARDEMVTSEQGLAASLVIAFILIIILLIVAFRMYSVPFIAGIPLLVGILWTAGATGLLIRRLNIMTAMYMVALLGLGIDYAIHLLTAYTQSRDEGLNFAEALREGMRNSGPGILTGALTTATAFFALSVSKTDVVRELGVVAGTGILCEMLAMLILIPALLGIRQNRLERKGRPDRLQFGRRRIRGASPAARTGALVQRRPWVFILVLLLLGGASFFHIPRVSIEDNLMNMEAKGLKSVALQETLVDEFGLAPDGLFILGEDLDDLRAISDALEDLETVRSVESLVPYLPSPEEQAQRRPAIERFRKRADLAGANPEPIDGWALLDELFRLEMNLLELGDMAYMNGSAKLTDVLDRMTGRDSEGVKQYASVFDRLIPLAETLPDEAANGFGRRLHASVSAELASVADDSPVTLSDIPRDFRDSYVSIDGSLHLMSVNPTLNPWEGEFRRTFREQVAGVTDRGTGMILAADELINMARVDGIRAAVIAFLVIFAIVLIDFRNFRMTVLTVLPLLFSMAVLMGLMGLFAIKFDFVNIIAIPLLIGIGIDDAVHISHRYLTEGRGSVPRVIEKTGSAVFLTTLTTVIGFASFIPSVMRAMRSTGVVLSLAMLLALVYSVLLHPAVIAGPVEKMGWNLTPWGTGGSKGNRKKESDQ